MKTIKEADFISHFEEQLVYANFNLREDIARYLKDRSSKETSEKNRSIIDIFIENNRLSAAENRAVCQDTGYIQVFIKLGRNARLEFDIEKAVNRTVDKIYKKHYLRQSIADPLTRENTGTNTPAFLSVELTEGEVMEVDIMIKGGGSENATRTECLLPTASEAEIVEWAVNTLKNTGSKACPPYVIGIGVGGNIEKAVHESKRLLLERINEDQMGPSERNLADYIKRKINGLDIGFQGLRFGETAMAVKVKTMPCHIATLPVALSIGCNAVRQGRFVI